jgi:hypothetical protein
MLNVLLAMISGFSSSTGDYFNKKALAFRIPNISFRFY